MLSCAMNAEKSPRQTRASKNAELNQISLRELAKRLGSARLEGLDARKRDFLGQRCEFLGLLGQRFELLA